MNFFPLDTSTKQTGLETGCMSFFTKLSLSCLEARVGFVDYVQPAASANYLAVRVSVLESFDGGYNFHKEPICPASHPSSTKQTGLESGCMSFFTRLSLSGFEARVGFVYNI